MRHKSFLVAAAAAALVVALPCGLVRADLEVTLPPGEPCSWYRELPARQPRIRAVILEKRDKGKPEDPASGETTLRGKEKITTEVKAHPELGSGTYQPKLFSGILTSDLPDHCGWVKRKGGLVPRPYPPTVTDDLYWTAQAAFLRRLLHPALVSEPEIYWYLVLLGQSTREVIDGAKAERFIEPLASSLERSIEKPPEKPPEPPSPLAGDTAEQKMLLRLATEDLMAGDPYSLDPSYAARLLSLAHDGFAALEACAKSDHAILRRNAVALIGNYYEEPKVLPLLRKVFREDKDATARTRALFHLVVQKDRDIVPDLLKGLDEAEDKRYPPLCAWALGVIGGDDLVDPLIQAIDKHKDDWDVIVAATVALSRVAGKDSKSAVDTLKKLVTSLTGPTPRFKEERTVSRPQADIPDVPELKNRMLLELAVAALARLGDKDGIAQLRLLIDGRWDDKTPVGHAKASGPERDKQCDSFKWVCSSSQELLIEAWGMLGPEGAQHLKRVIEHLKTNEHLRLMALRLDVIAKDKRFLHELALGSDSAAVRSLSMRELYNVDEKAGLKVAEATFAQYASGKPMNPKSPKGDVTVVTAIEILYRAKKMKVKPLVAALTRAAGEYSYDKPDISAEGLKPFHFSPPILETICWMLGATQEKDAIGPLKKLVFETKLPARAEAALGLAHLGDAALPMLVDLLSDEDGYVRYEAYLGLRAATGEDNFADWIYGTKSDMADAIGKYKEYLKQKKKK